MKKLLLISFMIISQLGFSQTIDETKFNRVIFEKVNEYRNKLGLPSWKYCVKLENIARHHATYLSLTGLIDHNEDVDIPNFTEKSFMIRFLDTNTPYGRFGENVGRSIIVTPMTYVDFAARIILAWENSPPHKELLVSTDFTYGAISIKASNMLDGKTIDKTVLSTVLNVGK